MIYYEIIDEFHSDNMSCHMQINWYVEKICNTTNKSGYIVQKYTKVAKPSFILSWNLINSVSINNAVKAFLFTICPNKTCESMFQSNLNSILNVKDYSKIKESLSIDWYTHILQNE